MTDIVFLSAANERKITGYRFDTLNLLSKIIWAGLILLVLSGMGILALSYIKTGSMPALASPKFQAKLTLVFIVLISGIVFAKKVLPFLGSKEARDGQFKKHIRLLATIGAVSIVSWYGILFLSVLPRGLAYPYRFYLGAYLAVLAGAVFVSNAILKKKLG